jgi:Rrf2 family protein
MSQFGSSVEMALHCLLNLAGQPADRHPSARDLAEFQGVSPSFVAKLFTRLEKAGIVSSGQGIQGGYSLARPAEDITVLEIVDAVEAAKPLFRCRNIRRNCILYDDPPPPWATQGVCGIHAVFLDAEIAMRDRLGAVTIGDLAAGTAAKIPPAFYDAADNWFAGQSRGRTRDRGSQEQANQKTGEAI